MLLSASSLNNQKAALCDRNAIICKWLNSKSFPKLEAVHFVEVARVMALASDLLGFLHDIPAPVPREVAAAAGVRQVWNLCNTWRQRNRQMYLRIMVTKSIGGQALLAARTAMSVCMLRLGTSLLPCEVLLRIMQFCGFVNVPY